MENLRENIERFIEAWESTQMAWVGDTDGKIAVEARIDEDYILISSLDGTIAVITDNNHRALYTYVPDDCWTFGDLIGGYLDLRYGHE